MRDKGILKFFESILQEARYSVEERASSVFNDTYLHSYEPQSTSKLESTLRREIQILKGLK